MTLGRRSAALKTYLDAMPGATFDARSAGRSATPGVLIYKIMGKMFAILSIRGAENVILKCDPHLAEMMREQYEGVGHRSHLDRRFWISVNLDADVPAKEIRRLAAHSYEQVVATLTRKQKADLAAQSS
ncbi:MAG: MmcQ/YjbR family DNA-binding protein [Alphaproteobacteria bacterium]